MSRISPRLAPTQVRCGAPVSGVSCWMRVTSWCVRARVEPSAPYVTETKCGASGARRCTERHSVASISTSAGGKNSNETFIADASWAAERRARREPLSNPCAPSRHARRAARPLLAQHRHRGQDMLAVSLDGAHALASQARLAEESAQPPDRMLHHPRAGSLERVVALEEQETTAGREHAPRRCEQPAEGRIGGVQPVEEHGIESPSEPRYIPRPEWLAARDQENARV